jgi:hypothetical protein
MILLNLQIGAPFGIPRLAMILRGASACLYVSIAILCTRSGSSAVVVSIRPCPNLPISILKFKEALHDLQSLRQKKVYRIGKVLIPGACMLSAQAR